MNQLGLKLKQRGLDAVEHSNLTWVEAMREYAKQVSAQEGCVCADDIREYANRIDWHPAHHNAFGAVFRPKWRDGIGGFVMMGWRASDAPSRHSAVIRVWRWQS